MGLYFIYSTLLLFLNGMNNVNVEREKFGSSLINLCKFKQNCQFHNLEHELISLMAA